MVAKVIEVKAGTTMRIKIVNADGEYETQISFIVPIDINERKQEIDLFYFPDKCHIHDCLA